jgi:hypothetical protein
MMPIFIGAAPVGAAPAVPAWAESATVATAASPFNKISRNFMVKTPSLFLAA